MKKNSKMYVRKKRWRERIRRRKDSPWFKRPTGKKYALMVPNFGIQFSKSPIQRWVRSTTVTHDPT